MTRAAPVLFGSLAGYRRRWLRRDVVAGLTVWAVLVPESLAYATIAGVPPVAGLYAAVPALVLYAAFGSSRHLVVGPMSATAALSAAIVAPLAAGDPARYVALTVALALVVGVLGRRADRAGRRAEPRPRVGHPAMATGGAGLPRGGVAGHRRDRGVPPRRAGCGHRGADPAGPACGGAARRRRSGSLPGPVGPAVGVLTLAAVVIAAVVELVDTSSLRRLYRVWTARLGRIYNFAARADFSAAIAAMLGVLVFDTLPGRFIGIAASMLL